jgi:hypothetical protein
MREGEGEEEEEGDRETREVMVSRYSARLFMLKEDEDDQAADRRAAPVGIRTFGLRKREKSE